MKFNENSRVKIPAILHLMKLGYEYIPLNQQDRRGDTNIFEALFYKSVKRINPEVTDTELKVLLDEISLELDYEDIGEKFYQRLTTAVEIGEV